MQPYSDCILKLRVRPYIIALFTFPCLRFIQETDVSSDLQVFTFNPDGAFVVLAILGIIDCPSGDTVEV